MSSDDLDLEIQVKLLPITISGQDRQRSFTCEREAGPVTERKAQGSCLHPEFPGGFRLLLGEHFETDPGSQQLFAHALDGDPARDGFLCDFGPVGSADQRTVQGTFDALRTAFSL